MPGLDERADLSDLLVMDREIEIVHGHRTQPRYAINGRPILDSRFENRPVEKFVKAGKQPCTPILAKPGERAEKSVSSPIRDSGDNQMLRRRHACDRVAMIDVKRNQLAWDGAHPNFVAAVTDRNCRPGPRREKLVQRRCVRADIEPSHIARGAVGAAPAALDRDSMRYAVAAPGCDDPLDISDIH